MSADASRGPGDRAATSFRLPEAPRPAVAQVPDDVGPEGFWRRGFPVVVVVVALVGLVVARVGIDALLDSTDGQTIDATAAPDEPGFEAIAEPTPIMAVATEAEGGELSSVAVLALSASDRGSVLVLPPDTIVNDGSAAPTVLLSAYRGGGADALGEALDRLLGFDAGEVLVLDERGWEQAVAPVAPFEVQLVDDVVVDVDGVPEVRWQAGVNVLAADEMADALDARVAGESDLVRMGRVEQIWTGWIAAVADGGDDAIAGEREVGLGRFVLGLAAGEAGFTTPPMVVAGLPDGGGELYALEAEGSAPLLLAAVPFPRSAFPGQRLRLQVLDGTGTPGAALAAAETLVAAGAEVATIGNADRFDVEETRLVYHRAEDLERVEAMRDALGGGVVALVAEEEPAVDVTVIIGGSTGGAGDG